MVPRSLFELQERRIQAAEDKANALRNYEEVRRTLKAERGNIDTDPDVVHALAQYEEAITMFDVARREHGAALSAHLNRPRGG